MRRFSQNPFWRIIKTILDVIVVLFIILFLLMVCLQRFTGNRMSLFNIRMFTVASGSMEPRYEVGDVLISKETAPSDIKIGDTVSYLGTKGDFNGKVITHEVIDIEQDSAGHYIFHTKGLSNLIEDPIVYENQLFGVVMYKSTILSFIYKVIGTKYGLLLFIIIPIFYIIGFELISAMLSREERKRGY